MKERDLRTDSDDGGGVPYRGPYWFACVPANQEPLVGGIATEAANPFPVEWAQQSVFDNKPLSPRLDWYPLRFDLLWEMAVPSDRWNVATSKVLKEWADTAPSDMIVDGEAVRLRNVTKAFWVPMTSWELLRFFGFWSGSLPEISPLPTSWYMGALDALHPDAFRRWIDGFAAVLFRNGVAEWVDPYLKELGLLFSSEEDDGFQEEGEDEGDEGASNGTGSNAGNQAPPERRQDPQGGAQPTVEMKDESKQGTSSAS